MAGRAQPGQSRAGAGLPLGHAGIFLGIALMLLGPAVEGGSSRHHILATLWLPLGMLLTFWLACCYGVAVYVRIVAGLPPLMYLC